MSQKAVVFDAGRVLVDFSFDSFRTFLSDAGLTTKDEQEFVRETALDKFEIGAISSETFLNNTKKLLRDDISHTAIADAFCNIFKPMPDMVTLCESLDCPVYILSNTNELHWNFLRKNYNIEDLCKTAYTSYDLGIAKPDTKIYDTVRSRIQTEHPNNILFIDDKKENVTGAIDAGWQAILHTETQSTESAIEKFLQDALLSSTR